MAHYNTTFGSQTIVTRLTTIGIQQMLNGTFNVNSYAFVDLTPYNLYNSSSAPGYQDSEILATPISIGNQYAAQYFLTTIDNTAQTVNTISINGAYTSEWILTVDKLNTLS